MSVYKRGEIWHYAFMIAGRRYRGSTKERTRSRARMIEAMLTANVREQRPSLIPKRAPIVREFASRFLTWVDNSQLAAESKEYYQRGWKMIKETDLIGMRLDEITTDAVEAIRFPGSPATVNCALRTFRRILGKAAGWASSAWRPASGW